MLREKGAVPAGQGLPGTEAISAEGREDQQRPSVAWETQPRWVEAVDELAELVVVAEAAAAGWVVQAAARVSSTAGEPAAKQLLLVEEAPVAAALRPGLFLAEMPEPACR